MTSEEHDQLMRMLGIVFPEQDDANDDVFIHDDGEAVKIEIPNSRHDAHVLVFATKPFGKMTFYGLAKMWEGLGRDHATFPDHGEKSDSIYWIVGWIAGAIAEMRAYEKLERYG